MLAALALVALAPSAIAQDGETQKRPPPEEMRAELEFSVAGGHFDMREYPAASKVITTFPSRIIADVEIFVANRHEQFGSTVGFWVFDETYEYGIRLMLSDYGGDLNGSIELMSTNKALDLASFNPRLRARDVTTVVVSRPTEKEIAFTVGGRTRSFKVDFVPAHIVFQAVGVDGHVEFTEPAQE
jgi:hypothetical protein